MQGSAIIYVMVFPLLSTGCWHGQTKNHTRQFACRRWGPCRSGFFFYISGYPAPEDAPVQQQ